MKASALGITLLASIVGQSTPASAVELQRFAYSGNAFGTSVALGNTVKSGPTALVNLGCATQAGVHKSNTVATLDARPLAFSGTVRTTADTSDDPARSRTTAETEGVSLLGGLIRADLVRAVSTTTHDGTGFDVSAAGSTFVNLRIGTSSIDANTAPNTRVDLLGLGHVVLNEQIAVVRARRAKLTVNMIRVVIEEENLLGYQVGTEIIVSHAQSGLEGPSNAFLDGRAYGTSVKALDGLLRSGPSALVVMPCLGTDGKVKSNSVLTVNLPNVLTSGTVRTTAQGTVTRTSATGQTTATIERLNLLDGLVRADVVKAVANASSDGTTPTFSDNGSQFLNLSVAGHADIDANVAPNTRLRLAGLGTLWLHRVIQRSDSIEVRMIELIVDDGSNAFGLPLGTVVRVAVAEASVH